jgi:leader peptidase (prepilin peptidase)/N-methyltransferase
MRAPITVSAAVAVPVVAGAYILAAAPAVLILPPLPSADVAAGVVLAAFLVTLTLIDLRDYRLPDWLTLPLAGLGIAAAHSLGWQDWSERTLAAIFGFTALFLVREIYARVRGREGLGLGDAKLLAASGAWTGLAGLPAVMLLACLLALGVVFLLTMAGRRIVATTAIPFGPFIAAGTWLVWLYGPLA